MAKKSGKSKTTLWLFLILVVLTAGAILTYQTIINNNTYLKFNLRGGIGSLDNRMKISQEGQIHLTSRGDSYKKQLSGEELAKFKQLVAQADLDQQGSNFAPTGKPETIYYELSFKGKELTYNDNTVPDNAQALVQFLTEVSNQILLANPAK